MVRDTTTVNEKLINSRKFKQLPETAQQMYIALVKAADDDGFNYKPMRFGSKEDYNLLVKENWLIRFSDVCCVIVDWERHHWYTEGHIRTKFRREYKQIAIDSYTHKYRFIPSTAIRSDKNK